MRKPINISTKIWFSISILIVGYFISMVFDFILGQDAESRLNLVSGSLFSAAKQSERALMAFKDEMERYNDAILTGEQSFIELAVAKAEETGKSLLIIKGLKGIDPQRKVRVVKLIKTLGQFNASAKRVYSGLSSFLDKLMEDRDKSFGTKKDLESRALFLAKKNKSIKSELSFLAESFSEDLKNELGAISAAARRQRQMNLVVFFCVVLVALILISFIISRYITRPLKKSFMLEGAVEQTEDGISVTDLAGKLEFVNQAWAKMHGYKQKELMDKDIFFFHSPKQQKTQLKPFLEKVVEKGTLSGEMGHMKQDGSTFISMMTMTLLKGEDDKNVRIVSIARDVTEKKKYEEELQKAKEAAEDANAALKDSMDILQKTQDHLVQSEKMASLGGLVAGVAHEINTPLGVGVTASSFLEEKTNEYNELWKAGNLRRDDLEKFINVVSEASAIILKNLNRAADLIRSFKQVAVDQSGEEKRLFNLKEYLDELLVSLRPNYKRTGHEVLVNCPSGIKIYSYPGVISQVITNLLMNSLTHAFADMEKGEIVLDMEVDHNKLFMRFRDNGCGMDGETLGKVFDPFFTTKRGQGGTGLGLHIVYNLVNRTMGGQIKCCSSPGEGTSFLIIVPLEDNLDTDQ